MPGIIVIALYAPMVARSCAITTQQDRRRAVYELRLPAASQQMVRSQALGADIQTSGHLMNWLVTK
ncbi:hypothetical protein BK637_17910 [Pseudomonas chlororaphis]|nr:hypothetical protein BK637_17910 [Pseudomonas chlororaphis]